MSVFLIAFAAGLSFLWAFVHLFVGGKQIAGPFRRDDTQNHRIMATLWMCWHMLSAVIFLMGGFFIMGLFWGEAFVLAGTMLAMAIAGAALLTVPALGTSFKVLPQGWSFVPIVLIGLYVLTA